ncbi:MAG: alpha-L-fucosidase [Candidatus Hinthialibacter antarcticus]|nr:alpha-L-fucosidase [Candidatus Hinthialibacter antarcticus]
MKLSFTITTAITVLFFSLNAYSQTFEPTWDSLKQYETPEWNIDAKFGIFIHWGAYAVPAHGSEWYPRNMYRPEDKIFSYHKEAWGDQSKFGYKDFIPMFEAEKWNPDEWAELFQKSGAKYVVPVAEHHDGFALYGSSHTNWNSVNMGPKRDICGDLAKAVRKRGMKFGVSSHYAWNWRYYNIQDSFDNSNPEFEALYGKRHEPDAPASEEFIAHWHARTQELIDQYQPDLLWFDFGFCYPEFEQDRKEIAAYYYNKGIEWNKGVALNYKRWTKPQEGVTQVAFPDGAGTLDLEREKSPRIREFFWQTDTSISKKSWGYIENDEFKSPNLLVDDLIDIVSKNGCMLLNIGPRADGVIPQEAQQVLLSIGKWLKLNGEAIYSTRPWKVYGEGPTGVAEGHLSENKNKPFTSEDIRFTQRDDVLYAIALEWPEDGTLKIKSLKKNNTLSGEIKSIKMIGSNERLQWVQDEGSLSVQFPQTKPCEFAFVLKIER